MTLPWFTFPAIAWLEQNIKAGMSVFEYGTGGSTLWFLEHGVSIVSVEHRKDYFDETESRVRDYAEKPTLLFIPPTAEACPDFSSSDFTDLCFRDYVMSILTYDPFDLVVVDGRARNACIREAMPKVKRWLLLDNTERAIYDEGKNLLKDWKPMVFAGAGMVNDYDWETTIWEKP